MKKILLVDFDRCTGCEACVDACSGHRTGSYSEKASCIRLLEDKPRTVFIPLVCEQCREHPCVDACPVEAIQYDSGLSIFLVHDDLCTACGSCEEVCPYQGIFVIEETALKCDLCGGEPACVNICYPRALQFVEVNVASVIADLMTKTKKLREIRSEIHDQPT